MVTHDIKLSLAANELKQPLHLKVRQKLREHILSDFQHGQRFYTERELIQKLEVSQATVRRSLIDLVGEGYLQNDPRRGFYVQRHEAVRYVGLVTPIPLDRPHEFNAEYIGACRHHHCLLNVHGVHSGETAEDILRLIRHKPTEERILIAGLAVERTIELGSLLQGAGYRHVAIDAQAAGFSGGSVSLDHREGAERILDYLTGMGHERICFVVNEPQDLLAAGLRARAVQAVLAKRALPHAQIVFCHPPPGESPFDAAYRKTGEIFDSPSRPTALVPLSGAGAWAALRHAVDRRIRVPHDLSIVSFDPMIHNEILPIPLTELTFSRTESAEKALRLLWSEQPSASHEWVSPKLAVRASTGPPRRD